LPRGIKRGGASPVGELTLRREPGRLRLKLAVSGPVTGDIMVFATPPCPPTWKKCRKERYLGLLPAPVNGVSDISELYSRPRLAQSGPLCGEMLCQRLSRLANGAGKPGVACGRRGEPEPGQRLFIRTCQQRDGWESDPVDTSNLVPAKVLPPQPHPSTSSFIIPASTLCFRRAHGMYTLCTPWLHPWWALRAGGTLPGFGVPDGPGVSVSWAKPHETAPGPSFGTTMAFL
jgi:hypothetical protein